MTEEQKEYLERLKKKPYADRAYSEEELESAWDNMTKVERDNVALYQPLTINFLEKHKAEINWTNVTLNTNTLTYEVLDKFTNKISWPTICLAPHNLQEGFLYNYRHKIIWTAVLSHQRLELEFLIRMSELYRKSRAKNQRDFWDAVSRYEKIDFEYVDAYKRFINFRLLSHNPNIDAKTIDKFIGKLDITTLWKSVTIPKEVLEKHRDKFDKVSDAAMKKSKEK